MGKKRNSLTPEATHATIGGTARRGGMIIFFVAFLLCSSFSLRALEKVAQCEPVSKRKKKGKKRFFNSFSARRLKIVLIM